MEKEQKEAIKELAELLHANNLSEIDYEANGVHIRVVGPKTVTTTVAAQPLTAAPNPAPAPTAEAKPVVSAQNQLLSPMVGIVYLSKSPNEPPFKKVGDTVAVGETICLIEAMKTFNPIKAEKAGRIADVLVESGSPVEFNQPLFVLE